jgi:hypothetical protein
LDDVVCTAGEVLQLEAGFAFAAVELGDRSGVIVEQPQP